MSEPTIHVIYRYIILNSPDSNYCMLASTLCALGRCLITSKEAEDFQACCSRDIHVDMSQDLVDLPKSTTTDERLGIFVTMAQIDDVLQHI